MLRVATDEILVDTIDDAVKTARDQAVRKGIALGAVQRTTPTSFTVTGVEPARVTDMGEILRDYYRAPEWGISEPGEGRFLVQMSEARVRALKERTVKEAILVLQRRVRELGAATPVIAAHGDDQILVQLPGVTEVDQARRLIQRTARLELKLVEDVSNERQSLLAKYGGNEPDNMLVVEGPGDQPGQPLFYLLRRESMITGRDLKNARSAVDENNQPGVSFTLTPSGAAKFKIETGRNVGRRVAIVLDSRVVSAPTIQSEIGAEGQITGRFTTQEVEDLAKMLRAGALPASVQILEERQLPSTSR